MKTHRPNTTLTVAVLLFAGLVTGPTLAQDAEPMPEATDASVDGTEAPREESPEATEASVDGTEAADASAEEDALLAQLSQPTEAPPELEDRTGLRFYGFSDFTVQRLIYPGGQDSQWHEIFASDRTNFMLGNLNLYFGGDLGRNFRTLSEVRFHLAPMGRVDLSEEIADPTASPYTDVSAEDFNDMARPLNWGGIEIERSYIEYAAHPNLTVRVGRILTPYGIWNVDHGTPVIMTVRRPYVIGNELFPERQTGFEVYGSFDLDSGTIGYNLTLSNGRGPLEAMIDLDKNKAIGGRLYFQTRAFGEFQVGVSGYYGSYTDRRRRVDLATGHLAWFDYVQFNELGLAADIRLQSHGFIFQAEAISQQVVYGDGHHPSSSSIGAMPGDQVPNSRRLGVYGILGYRIPRANLTAYGIVEWFDMGYRAALVGSNDYVSYSAGLTWRATPNVVLKMQGGLAIFPHAPAGTIASDNLGFIETQISYAF